MALLEVFIGLFFIYVLLSLFASIIQELVSGIVSLRGRTLVQALAKLLEFDGPRERILLKRYLRHHNSSYKKLISSNLGVRRLPSYLSRDQLISIIEELADVKRRLKLEEEEKGLITISTKNRRNFIKTYSGIFKRNSEDIDLDNLDSNIRAVEIRPHDIFPWRWISLKLIENIVGIFRMRKSNKEFVYRNLPVLEYRMTHIKQKKLEFAIQHIKEQANGSSLVSDYLYEKATNDLFEMYDDFMNRARGWFKRKVQFYLIVTGFLIAFYTNSDTIEIFNKLSSDPLARSEVVSMAEKFIENNSVARYSPTMTEQDSASIDSVYSKLYKLMESELKGANSALGLGWDYKSFDYIKVSEQKTWYRRLCATILMPFDLAIEIAKKTNESSFKWIGFLLTALAISLGASFWFDLLKRLINIRNAGVRPDALVQRNPHQAHTHLSESPVIVSQGQVVKPTDRIVG